MLLSDCDKKYRLANKKRERESEREGERERERDWHIKFIVG